VRRFVHVLHEAVGSLNKQIIISTHSLLFIQERLLGKYFHITKSKHFITHVRNVDQNNLLEELDVLNAPPEAILQSDIILYTEGPTDIAVLQEFIKKFSELEHTNITVLHLGGGSMGNIFVDPLDLKKNNPLSLILIDSERKHHGGEPDPAHAAFQERCTKARLHCMMVERQALENYFTPRALHEVFGTRIPGRFENKPYKPLTHQGLPWYEKQMNRAVARAMTREEIESYPDLREFFREVISLSKQVQ
jgi:putative ATP-dependent endonuclease of OLD family